MTDQERIEEMARSCCSSTYKTCEDCIKASEKVFGKIDLDDCKYYSYASKFFSKGYHKTIWHKVADGDLPTHQGQKVWLCTISEDYFMANYYDDTEVGGKRFFEVASEGRIILSNVLAWAELPQYEE